MLKNRKGFTLVELIIVVAILGILAAIAVPNLTGIRYRQQVNADASTANNIVRAARLQFTDTGTELSEIGDLKSSYFDMGDGDTAIKPQSNPEGEFTLSYEGDSVDKFTVSWTPNLPGFTQEQSVTEGKVFSIVEDDAE